MSLDDVDILDDYTALSGKNFEYFPLLAACIPRYDEDVVIFMNVETECHGRVREPPVRVKRFS